MGQLTDNPPAPAPRIDAPLPDRRNGEPAASSGLSSLGANWKWLAVLNRPAFAYITILLFELKKIWGLWNYRDLPLGDTPQYFGLGYQWFRHQQADFAWSPLYTAFYGSFLHFSNDAYGVTNLHRVAIVLLAAVLVLAVLRQLLPHPIAWLTAAWWAALPVNHNTEYDVHLFALLPVLVFWLVVLRRSGPWGRGTGMAILLATTFLVRNELIVAFICWAGVCLIREWWERRRAPGPSNRSGRAATVSEPIYPLPHGRDSGKCVPWARVALAYALPAALACLLAGWFYSRSPFQGGDLKFRFERKHMLNMAQVYTFGYQQRHPEWIGDPWREFAGLCQRDFGTPLPTFTQMLRRNPHAALEHLGWNLKLLPSGLQLLLFDAYSGSFSPDYEYVAPEPAPARRDSAAVLVLIAAGLVLLCARRRWWWDNWFASRWAGWAAMLVIVVVAGVVIPTQRPRPAYLFALGVVLMTIVGMSAFVVLATVFRRWPQAGGLAQRWMPALMLVLPAITHSPYAAGMPALSRPVQRAYREMLPFQDTISHSNAVLVEEDLAEAFGDYLGQGECSFLGYSVLRERMPREPLPAFLDRKGISLFRVNEACWAQLEAEDPGSVQGLIANGNRTGWWLIGFADTNSRWLLFRRAPAGPPASGAAPRHASAVGRGLEPPAAASMYAGLRCLSGLGPAEMVNVQFDPKVVRWGLWPATRLAPRDPAGGWSRLMLKGVACSDGQCITLMVDGQVVGKYPWPQTVSPDLHELSVPLDMSAGEHEIELRYATSGKYERAFHFYELRLVKDGQ